MHCYIRAAETVLVAACLTLIAIGCRDSEIKSDIDTLRQELKETYRDVEEKIRDLSPEPDTITNGAVKLSDGASGEVEKLFIFGKAEWPFILY